MRSIKSALKVLKRNWSTLLWFEILYRTVGYVFVYPALNSLLNQSLKAAGTAYISQENALQLLKHPISILFLLLMLVLFSFFVYFELAAFILCYEAGWNGRHISLIALGRGALLHSARLFHYRNFLLFIGLVPLFAISFFRVSSTVLNNFRIPEFIMEFIQANTVLFVLYALLLLFINLYVFFFLFGLPDAILHRSGIRGALRASKQSLKKRKLRTLISIILCLAGLTLLVLIIAALCVAVVYGITRSSYPLEEARYNFRWELTALVKIGNILLEIFYTAAIMAIIVTLNHLYNNETPTPVTGRSWRPVNILKKICAVLMAFFLLGIFSESEVSGNPVLPPNPATEIVAHRAGAVFAPENTLAALDQAVLDRADWAEIDVQQTKDGVLIVMHDSNFKRVTGYNADVWDTDYETVKNLDAGAFFDSDFAGERIPTLEEMLIQAKNRINLMIELKYTGHEQQLVEKTIELIEKYHMEAQCTIVSMNMDILQKVKELAPNLKTAYVTALLLTDNYDLKNIDGYSVETTNISYTMVAQAHLQGKKVYAWTANSERTINAILSSQADGIVTDNPQLARYYLEDDGELSLVNILVNLFYPVTSEQGRQELAPAA